MNMRRILQRVTALEIALSGSLAWGQSPGLESTPFFTATGGDGELLGSCVAAAGDLDHDGHLDFLVGSEGANTPYTLFAAEGAVLVYRGAPSGAPPTLYFRIDGDTPSNIGFGRVCGSAGDVNGDGWEDLFVAAPVEMAGGVLSGTVRVFHGGPSGAITGANLIPGDADWYADCTPFGSAQFGTSVAAVGDVDGNGCDDLLVGAPFANAGAGVDSGAAFLFLGSPSGLAGGMPGSPATAAWSAFGTAALMNLGAHVYRAGDTNADGAADFVVHAPTFGGPLNRGHIWLFHGVTGGLPPLGLVGAWLDSDPPGQTAAVNFGTALTATDFDDDGFDDLAIGAFSAQAGGCGCGAVYFYAGGPDGPGAQYLIPVPLLVGGASALQFGRSLAAGDFDGDTIPELAVGAPAGVGGVHVYSACSLPLYCGTGGTPYWTSSGTQPGQQYGIQLACIGDSDRDGAEELLIGAPKTTVINGTGGDGQVFLFDGQVVGPAGGCVDDPPDRLVPGTQPNGLMGVELECADFTGDGIDDVLVTDYEPGNEHVVRLHRGSASGPEAAPVWESAGPAGARYYFGWAIADAGDVDGDLDHEILVADRGRFYGGWGASFGFVPGYVRLYLGGDPPATTHVWEARASGPGPIDFGFSCAGIGDLDGDGELDVAVGALGHLPTWPGDPYPGVLPRIYVYRGPLTGSDDETTADFVVTSDQYDHLGWSLARAGDVNLDGRDDLLAGAPLRNGTFDNGGAAFVWLGAPGGFISGASATPVVASWYAEGQWNDAQFGFAVEGGANLTGDLLPEVAVGAPYDTSEGSVSVFYNDASSGLATTPGLVLRGEHPNYNVGTGVRMLERFNSDGYADLAIHGNVTNPEPQEGRIFVHFGSAVGVPAVANWWVESDVRGGVFGLAGRFDGGDVDGDGFTDLLGGCPGWPGDVLQNDQPGAFMGWRGSNRSQLAVAPTSIPFGRPIDVRHHGGKPGATVYFQVIAVDGVQLALPRTLAKGPSDAERCFVAPAVTTTSLMANHVYSVRCVTRSDSGAVVRSETVHLTVL